MRKDLSKTLSFLALHLMVGFTVAYVFTGSIAIAGGIALIEPLVNAVVFFFHERAWNRRYVGSTFSWRGLFHPRCTPEGALASR